MRFTLVVRSDKTLLLFPKIRLQLPLFQESYCSNPICQSSGGALHIPDYDTPQKAYKGMPDFTPELLTKAAEKFFTTHENRCIQKDDRSLSRSHRTSKDALTRTKKAPLQKEAEPFFNLIIPVSLRHAGRKELIRSPYPRARPRNA